MTTETVQTRLAGLPTQPGVYIMRDARNRVIYVGKAINLRNRVRSYFQDSAAHTGKTQQLVLEIADLDWIVTQSELEALILECELIKKYRPRFNIRLKDDKRYPYIKVTWYEDYPRILIVRNMAQDGGRYFGAVHLQPGGVPQPGASCAGSFPTAPARWRWTARSPVPACITTSSAAPARASGPSAARTIAPSSTEPACSWRGKQEQIIARMTAEMAQAAAELRFEHAAEPARYHRSREPGNRDAARRLGEPEGPRLCGLCPRGRPGLRAGLLYPWRQADRPGVLCADGHHRRVPPQRSWAPL